MGYGTITAYALLSLEPRGTLFVTPGMEVGTSQSHLLLFHVYMLYAFLLGLLFF